MCEATLLDASLPASTFWWGRGRARTTQPPHCSRDRAAGRARRGPVFRNGVYEGWRLVFDVVKLYFIWEGSVLWRQRLWRRPPEPTPPPNPAFLPHSLPVAELPSLHPASLASRQYRGHLFHFLSCPICFNQSHQVNAMEKPPDADNKSHAFLSLLSKLNALAPALDSESKRTDFPSQEPPFSSVDVNKANGYVGCGLREEQAS